MKNFIKNLVGSALMMLTFGNLAMASNPDVDAQLLDQYINSSEMSVGACFAKGDMDLISFYNSVSLADGFLEGTMQPFVDIIGRNSCQSADITNLRQQRDKIRERIREAFLTCNWDQLPSLKKAHLKYNIEIFYIRNIMQDYSGLPLSIMVDDMKANSGAYFRSRDEMYTLIYDKYFDHETMTPAEFDAFFRTLEVKYDKRKESYLICESSSFAVLEERWQQFIENMGGLKQAGEEFERGVVGRGEKLALALESLPQNVLFNFFGGKVDMSLNNMSPEQGLPEIMDFLISYLPETSTVQQTDVIGALSREREILDLEQKELELRGQFEVQYKDAGDEAVRVFTGSLSDLNTAIQQGVAAIKKVVSCSNAINNKQCVISQ